MDESCINIGNSLLDKEKLDVGTNNQMEEALEVLRTLLLSAEVPANVKRTSKLFLWADDASYG